MTTRDAVMTWILVASMALVSAAVIVGAGHRDRTIPVRYDCALLIGSWHPDFPKEAIEACRKKGINYDSSKTSYR